MIHSTNTLMKFVIAVILLKFNIVYSFLESKRNQSNIEINLDATIRTLDDKVMNILNGNLLINSNVNASLNTEKLYYYDFNQALLLCYEYKFKKGFIKLLELSNNKDHKSSSYSTNGKDVYGRNSINQVYLFYCIKNMTLSIFV